MTSLNNLKIRRSAYLFSFTVLSAISGNGFSDSENYNILPNKKIELICGKNIVSITCGKVIDQYHREDNRECNRNILSFSNPDGELVTPPLPKGLDLRKTPIGISCTQSKKNGNYYVIVELSLGVNSAVQWTTFHLFSSTGIRITADLTDKMSQLGKAMKNLNISYTKFIYIEGEMK